MKQVVQENEMGCGVACVASVGDLSYKKAISLFDQTRDDSVGFYCKDIVNALNELGLSYKYKYVNKRTRNTIYNNKSVVFIKRSRKYPQGHYLTRCGNKWMDPWVNYPNKERKSGFRKRLPGRPIYVIFRG